MIDEKEEQQKDIKFIKNAVNSNSIRGVITKHYLEIVKEEMKIHKRQNKSLALKLFKEKLVGNDFFVL